MSSIRTIRARIVTFYAEMEGAAQASKVAGLQKQVADLRDEIVCRDSARALFKLMIRQNIVREKCFEIKDKISKARGDFDRLAAQATAMHEKRSE